eukprot:1363889-Amorphochlora_amoeboformis.AAC.2
MVSCKTNRNWIALQSQYRLKIEKYRTTSTSPNAKLCGTHLDGTAVEFWEDGGWRLVWMDYLSKTLGRISLHSSCPQRNTAAQSTNRNRNAEKQIVKAKFLEGKGT